MKFRMYLGHLGREGGRGGHEGEPAWSPSLCNLSYLGDFGKEPYFNKFAGLGWCLGRFLGIISQAPNGFQVQPITCCDHNNI